MAEQVNQMPGVAGRTPVSSYPWDQWLDPDPRKKPWHLIRGEDYTVSTTTIRAYAYRLASRRGLIAETVRDPGGTGITIKAHHPPPTPQAEPPHDH